MSENYLTKDEKDRVFSKNKNRTRNGNRFLIKKNAFKVYESITNGLS
jgi:hypothetical protein